MAYLSKQDFCDRVFSAYHTARSDAQEANRQRGRRHHLGQQHGARLFESAIASTGDSVGACEEPYSTAYADYTRRCLNQVWPTTRSKVHEALVERYQKNLGLPKQADGRRKIFKEIVGEKAYYAIVNSLGGYFELALVVEAMFERAKQDAAPLLEESRIEKKSRGRRRRTAADSAEASPPATTARLQPSHRRPLSTSAGEQLSFPFV